MSTTTINATAIVQAIVRQHNASKAFDSDSESLANSKGMRIKWQASTSAR